MNTPKPKPQIDEFHTARICNKCSGTGFFCTHIVDGVPQSRTGFTCYGCDGTGWKVVIKRGQKQVYREHVYATRAIKSTYTTYNPYYERWELRAIWSDGCQQVAAVIDEPGK